MGELGLTSPKPLTSCDTEELEEPPALCVFLVGVSGVNLPGQERAIYGPGPNGSHHVSRVGGSGQ